MDTVEAIELASAGSRTRDALLAELDGHGPLLLAAARVITLDSAEAEDLVQTTFEIAPDPGRDRAPSPRRTVGR